MPGSQSTKAQWDKEKTLKLIEEYRKREILWKKSDPDYYNHYLKIPVWKELALTMNVTQKCCMHKMKIMKHKWSRQNTRIKSAIARGVDPDSTDKMESYHGPYQKALDFLKENEIQATEKDLVEINIVKNESSDITDQESQQQVKKKKFNRKRSLSSEKKKSSKGTDDRDAISDNAPQVMAQTSGTKKRIAKNANEIAPEMKTRKLGERGVDNDNEIKYFSKFIGTKMKKYTQITKNIVQREICEILFRADENYYDTTSGDFEILVDIKNILESDTNRDLFNHEEGDVVVD